MDIGDGKSIIAMPKFLPLDDIPLSSLRTEQCYKLLRQLVEGLAFLHEHGVAHLDLKSPNIVIDTALERLYIIDFGLAERVSGPEDTVYGFRGTKHWVAPEVEDGNYAYSAVRADLWAAGELIETVMLLWHKGPDPCNTHLQEVVIQLRNPDPGMRPLLTDVIPVFEDNGHPSSGRKILQTLNLCENTYFQNSLSLQTLRQMAFCVFGGTQRRIDPTVSLKNSHPR
jgi:serine/threonine protein kinase